MTLSVSYGVLTYNAISFLRMGLLEETLRSIENAFPGCKRIIMDNGSGDGTDEYVKSLDGGYCYVAEDGDHRPGRGNTVLANKLLEFDTDIIVMSDDDMHWKSKSLKILQSFWSQAPENLVVLCGMLEPVWHWNIPMGTIECNGIKALVRASAPTAAWTFRSKDWPRIGKFDEGFGHDYKKCQDLDSRGLRIAQLDLATHLGWGYSSHDNRAIESAEPIDKKEWGLE